MTFSATDAAFEGFRVTRKHPFAVMAWAGVMVAANLVSTWAVAALAGANWSEFQAATAAASPDPALLAELAPKVVSAIAVSMAIQVVAAAAVNASMLRALLRPERRAWLGFGRDEVRVSALLALFFLASFGATLLLAVILGLLGPLLGPLAGVLAFVASGVVLLILTVRLSLAGPMTIAEHRLRFRASWPATRSWFWPLLAAEALAAALAALVAFLAQVVFLGVAGAVVVAGGGALSDVPVMINHDFSTPARMLAPLPLAYLLFVSVLYALVLVLLAAPPVELYRHLNPETPEA